jgi:hypothetical protein
MVGWIETELKLLLPGAEAWQTVRSALGGSGVVVQRNHFFDRPDAALRAARIGVRLREEAGRLMLTVKGERARPAPTESAAAVAGAVASRIELECELPPEALERALREGLDLRPWLARWRAERSTPTLPPELAGFLAGLEATLADGRLVRQAGFVNERETLRLPLVDAEGAFEVELALDRTRFPDGRVDHELEVELVGPSTFVDRVERAVRAWLAAHGGIEGRPAPSKLARLHAGSTTTNAVD